MNNTASRGDQLYVGDFSSRNEHFSLASNLVQLRRMSIYEKKRGKRAFGFELNTILISIGGDCAVSFCCSLERGVKNPFSIEC